MSDVSARWTHHATDLADAERWEVVMVDETLGRFYPDPINHLLVAQGTECADAKNLCLPAGKETGAVGPREHADFAGDGTNLIERASIWPNRAIQDRVSHGVVFHVVVNRRHLFRGAAKRDKLSDRLGA